MSDQHRVAREILGQVLVMSLEGPAADFEQLRVAPQPLDNVFAHVPVASLNLNGRVGCALRRLGSEQLRGVRVHALSGRPKVDAARRIVNQRSRGSSEQPLSRLLE